MRRFALLSALFALFLFAGFSGAAVTNVTTCQTISASGFYDVNTSLFIPDATCLTVTANDVNLDCRGNTISGNLNGDSNIVAVYVSGRNNFTAYNCRLLNYSKGFFVTSSSNVTLRNNTIWNMSQVGIDVFTAVNSSAFYNNTLSYAVNGINFNGVQNSTLYNNRIHNMSQAAIYLAGGSGNNVTNNTVWNGTNTGIQLASYENLTYVFNNTVFNITEGGAIPSVLFLGDNYNTTVFRNTLYNNSDWGIRVSGGAYVNVSYNSVSNQTGNAMRLENGVAFSNFDYNTLNRTGGVHLGGASYNNTFRSNTIEYSTQGISLQTGPQNTTIRGNTFRNLTGAAIGLSNSSFNYVYSNNVTQSTSNVLVTDALSQNNTVYSNNASFIYATAFSLSNSTDNVLYDNRVENVVGGSAFQLWSYAHRNRFYDNVDTGHPNGNGFSILLLSENNTVWRNNFTFLSFGVGLDLSNSSYNNFSYNRIINVSSNCMTVTSSATFNTLQANTLANTSTHCVYFGSQSSNNTVSGNDISFVYGGASGIAVANAQNNTYRSNTIYNVSGNGISVDTSSNTNRIISNVITNTSERGIQVVLSSLNNTVASNNVSFAYNGYQGILVDGYSNYANVSYNLVQNVTGQAVSVMGQSQYATVKGNTIINTTGSTYGIHIYNGTWYATVLDNAINNTMNGILVSLNSSNNTFRDNSIYFTPGVGVLIDSASNNNTLLRNTIINHTSNGVQVDASQDNYVQNNTLANSTGGFSILFNANTNRTLVEYNNASFAARALSMGTSDNNTVRYNRFFNHSGRIVNLEAFSDYNTFTGNIIENTTADALIFAGSTFGTWTNNSFRSIQQLSVVGSNNTFINNNLTEMLQPSLSLSGANNTFQGNNFSYGGWVCVLLDGATDNYFDNNVYQSCMGLVIRGISTFDRFIGDRLVGLSGTPLTIQNASTGLQFTNVTIPAFGPSGITLNQSSSAVFLNVTFDKTSVSIYDAASNLTYRWYVRVNVTDQDGGAVNGASVSVVNTTGMNESAVNVSQTSGSDGLTPFVAVTEAFLTMVSTNNVSSYNFTAGRLGLYSNSSLFNVTQSGTVTVQVNVPPVVVLSSPLDGLFNRSRTVIFRYVPTDADDVTFLNCSVWTNETTWSIKASNASSITNGSNNSISVTFSSDGFYRWNVGCFDRSAEGALSTANFTIRIDNTTPSGFAYISPTLANGSESALNYSEVNVSFTEANPDSCLLEFNNGTAANYSMNRSGNSCFGNVTISNTGDFNYTVWANDSLGNWNNSVRRFVTLTDDATPPSVSLSSPADSAALSSLSSLVFSFSDAVSSTASCTVYVDGSSVYSNASVLNGTLTSASVSVSSGAHLWNVSCTDAGSNQGNSSVFSFSLSSGGGSGSPSVTPVPVVPSVTPVASVVPVVSVQPSVEPSAAPVEATVEPVEEVVVPVEEVTKTTEPVVLESGGASSEGVVVRTSYSVSSVVVPSGGTRSISRVLVETTNVGSLALEALQVTREFKFLECLGSDPSAYEAVGVVFSPRPFRIECGSAVVTWLFDNVEPGESVTAEAKVPGELTREQVSEGISTPRVVARAAQAAKVVSTPSATASASVSVSPTPGGFDWTLPALGVLVLLGVGAYFVFGRKQQGL